MLLLFSLFQKAKSWTTIHADRLIQFQKNSSQTEQFGSTRSPINHDIAFLGSKPNSANAIFIPLEKATKDEVLEYLNVSSPIIFLVPKHKVNLDWLTPTLISANHKAPIYFTFDQTQIPKDYSKVMTTDLPSNSQIKKVKLQNIIGTINGSSSYDRERVALITAPYDSFSLIPAAKGSANENGLSISVLLETMRQLSRYPITNNWVFLFALVDGHFCNSEGLEKFVSKLTKEHGPKIEFALSLESISSPTVQATFGLRLRRESAFAKFMFCFVEALKTAEIPFTTSLNTPDKPTKSSENESEVDDIDLSFETKWTDVLPPFGKTENIFSSHTLPSVSISGGSQIGYVNDTIPNIERGNLFAWALSEAFLRMMYDSDNTAQIIEKSSVSIDWAEIVTVPRMPAFRDSSLASVISQWMKKFGTSSIDEWSTSKCYSPSNAKNANIVLYNPTSPAKTAFLFFIGIIYGIVVYVIIAGKDNVLKLLSGN